MTPVYTSGLPGAETVLWHLALLTLAGWVLGYLIWKRGTRGNPLLIVRALRGGIRNYSSAGSLTFEGWNALNTLRKKKIKSILVMPVSGFSHSWHPALRADFHSYRYMGCSFILPTIPFVPRWIWIRYLILVITGVQACSHFQKHFLHE